MQFHEQFNKKIIIVTTPSRSGGMFLYFLLKDYFPDDYNVDVVFGKHNSSFLTIDNESIKNIMTIRDPVDMACSLLYYATEDIKDNKMSHNIIIEGVSLILDSFYNNFFKSKNNILFSFDNLINKQIDCIKLICKEIDQEYNEKYNFDINRLKSMDKKEYSQYTYNFPRKIPNKEYEKNKFIVLSDPITKKTIVKYKEFIKTCIKNNVKGIYV